MKPDETKSPCTNPGMDFMAQFPLNVDLMMDADQLIHVETLPANKELWNMLTTFVVTMRAIKPEKSRNGTIVCHGLELKIATAHPSYYLVEFDTSKEAKISKKPTQTHQTTGLDFYLDVPIRIVPKGQCGTYTLNMKTPNWEFRIGEEGDVYLTDIDLNEVKGFSCSGNARLCRVTLI